VFNWVLCSLDLKDETEKVFKYINTSWIQVFVFIIFSEICIEILFKVFVALMKIS